MKWTKKELQFALDNFGTLTCREIAKKLGRSYFSIRRCRRNHFSPMTEETKKELRKRTSQRRYSMKGENNPNWKDGISKNGYWYNKKRRARKLEAGGSHTLGEWELLKKQYGYTCPCCKKSEPEIKLTEDHIIPLSKGGSDNIENIQPLCGSCNSKKHTKVIKYPDPCL